MENAPLSVLTRFPNRHKQIIFHDDVIAHNEVAWITSKLPAQARNNELHIQSTRFDMNGIYDPNSKLNISAMACNVITPFRVLEWIYIDSIK